MKKLLLILAFTLVIPFTSSASTGDNVSGFAWSHNTGWIKLNSCVNNNCDPVAYGVNIDSSGNFSGYGWSPNVGWVNFNPTSCGQGARANFAGNGSATITGWIRVESAADAGNNSGGWNGCIKMAGQTGSGSSYGVVIGAGSSPQQFSGYGWNANNSNGTIVGDSWIDFSGASYTRELSSLDLSIDHWNPECTPTNNKINLSWTTIGITPNSCHWTSELSGSAADNANGQLFNLGNQQSSYIISLSCNSPIGTETDTVTVNCNDSLSVTISATPSALQSVGTTTLTWQSTGATNCIATDGPGFGTNGATSGTDVSSTLTGTHDFTVECTDGTSVTSDTVTVTVPNNSEPFVNLSAPSQVSSGSNYTITWKTKNIRAASGNQPQCFATTTGTSDTWNGNKTGNTGATLITNTQSINSPADGTYYHTLLCYGDNNATISPVTDSVFVTVGDVLCGQPGQPQCPTQCGQPGQPLCPKIAPKYEER